MITGAVPVQFVFAEWTAIYPEFAGLSSVQGQAYFDLAGLYCRNDATSPVNTAAVLKQLLYMLTAHIAWLNCPKDAQGNPAQVASGSAAGIVGRINSASEGSVSVQSEYSTTVSGSQAWYIQTKYGAAYWEATAPFRTMLYRPGPVRVIVPVAPGSGPYG